jgi:hypothetical protein
MKRLLCLAIAVSTTFCVLAQEVMPSASVRFHSSNELLQLLFDSSQMKSKWNIQQFEKYKVLVEGAGYSNVWLETQPMGGAMFATTDPEIALNNQLIFIDHQRSDGRLPGMISISKGKLFAHYGWFQGFCFPQPAFELYYWNKANKDYLQKLYSSLERFDAYLWRTRDSDKDGCLETWCVWDSLYTITSGVCISAPSIRRWQMHL